MMTDLAVIILTFNEQENLAQALTSVCGWAAQVFVFDSYSTDRTLEIARQFDCQILQHPFVDYGTQRNAALEKLPISASWVFFLDADEWLMPELKEEIACVLRREPIENGFYLKRRLIWMGKWIRRGYYPTWLLRLFRYGKGRCEDRTVNEHIVVEGACGRLANDLIHEDRKGLEDWIAKHNHYSTREAQERFRMSTAGQLKSHLWGGSPAERKRWIQSRVWNRLPLISRPLLYFFYRYFWKGGFLDGIAGFTYHFLQALWFWMIVDVKCLEMKRAIQRNDQ